MDARPQLLAYGLSLGAHGTQAVFSEVDELRARTDGALLVGSPNGSTMWRTLQSQRDAGTPEWQPVLDGGRQVRWMSRPGDGAAGQGEWERPRVLYLQHATDPITWLSPELFWRRPEWLTPEQRSADLSPSMHWIPVVTGLQVTLDMLVSEAVPASYGHNFGDVVLTGWEQVSTGSALDAAALERVQAQIATYAQIPLFRE